MSEEIDEIWALYADDGGQSLDGVEEALLALKANASDGEAIAALFRAMHTFKGNSRLLGLTAIESCAHLAEDLIGLVRDEGVEIDREFLALLLEAADVLRAMMEATLSTRRDADPDVAASISERIREKFERSRTGSAASKSIVQPCSATAGNDASPDAEESAEAVVFEPVETPLADDPLYREIFLEFARDCLTELRQAKNVLDPCEKASTAALADIANRLQIAAEQIGIAEWPELAGRLAKEGHLTASVEAAIERMSELCEHDPAALNNGPSRAAAATAEDFVEFVDRLEPLIVGLIAAAEGQKRGEEQDADYILSFTRPMAEAAELLGFVRLIDTASRFQMAARDQDKFNDLLFELYGNLKLIEELSAVSESSRVAVQRSSIARLGAWCTGQGKFILNELGDLLASSPTQIDTAETEKLLRHLQLICKSNGAEVVGRVAMTLSDLIARIEPLDSAGHPISGQIKAFIELAAPFLTTNTTWTAPDMVAMEDLLQKLTVKSGSAEIEQLVEARLGLPAHLQGCLTASSAQAAQAALDEGKPFYIVRADLSADENMAQRFSSWLESGAAEIISSVTIFQGTTTVFDFLIASALEREALESAISVIDPDGNAVRLELSLSSATVNVEPLEPAKSATVSQPELDSTSVAASAALLESIGELITGHSAMGQVIADFEEEDLFALIEAELRNHTGNWNQARASVRSLLDRRQERAEELAQIQTQMAAILGRVQAEALSSRSRPASSLLDAISAFGQENALSSGRTVSVKTSGGDEAVDLGLLQTLEKPLCQLVSECLENEDAASGKSEICVSISLVQNEDQVCVTVEKISAGGALTDTAKSGAKSSVDCAAHAGDGFVGHLPVPKTSDLEGIRRLLRLNGGEVRSLKTSEGETAFRVTMPLAMAVLEGMVVRVGDMRYVVPIQSIQRIVHSDSDNLIRVSASNGRLMLKLSHDDVLPVSLLAGNGPPLTDLGLAATARNDSRLEDGGKHLFVVAGNRERRIALAIDELIGQQTVLLRPLKGYLSAIKDVTWCALLGSGGVGMVLDMRAIIERE